MPYSNMALRLKTRREGYVGKSKGACYGAPRGPGAHRIRGPCGSHSQPPSHWQQYSTGGLILRILNRRLDLNNHLHLSEHTVCTHTRAANFACRAPQWSSLSLRACCPCTDVASHADLDGSDRPALPPSPPLSPPAPSALFGLAAATCCCRTCRLPPSLAIVSPRPCRCRLQLLPLARPRQCHCKFRPCNIMYMDTFIETSVYIHTCTY